MLVESEINELYSPPNFSLEERRFYFTLNDREAKVAKSIRRRAHKCYFVALLGYFKSKPVALNLRFGQIEHDLQFISSEQLPGPGLRRFTLDQKQRNSLYQKVFGLWTSQGPIYWDMSEVQRQPFWGEGQKFATLFTHLIVCNPSKGLFAFKIDLTELNNWVRCSHYLK